MSNSKRWIWIVLDSVGIGAAPDAERYGEEDVKSNTLGHIAEAVNGLQIPNLAKLGLGCIADIRGVPCENPNGAYGKMQEQSAGKDTTNGHWEFVGVILNEPLPVYPNGFPIEIIKPFEDYIGKKVLCNRPASGTEVIEKYGNEHVRTGCPIVYTSGDSVFQIAVHEAVVPVDVLYDWCLFARRLLSGEHGVGRVIARPFEGSIGHYQRTHRRRDYSLDFGDTVLNHVADEGFPVCGIGKISDIYGGSGITRSIPTDDNADAVRQLIQCMDNQTDGIIYANLVDFDALYGHRNDAIGFARAVEAFDMQLPQIQRQMQTGDILCITADHGCDPTTVGTDHSREYVPLLVWHPQLSEAVNLNVLSTFADIGATVADYFSVAPSTAGQSFLHLLQL